MRYHKASLQRITFVGNIVGKLNITIIMTAPTNTEEIQKLINSELETMEPKLRNFAHSILTNIEPSELLWEYGNNEKYPGWAIGDLKERDVIVMYCSFGHGSKGRTWGINFSHSKHFGQDNCWYSSLKELLLDGWFE